MNDNTVFIACATDRNFTTPMVVMLKSLLTNFKNNRKIVIYILTTDLRYFCRKKLLKSLKTERADIRFVHLNDKLLKKMKVTKKRITLATYYRLLLPIVLPEERRKVIYLDSDLIVNTDIGKLWDLDIGQNYILAVQEQSKDALYVSSPEGLLSYKELNIDPASKQFNTGVMSIDLDKWRKNNISQKVIDYIGRNKEKIRWWDQDGLNALLAGKWGELDHRWNLLTQTFWNHSWEEGPIKDKGKYEELINRPYIVHFNTGSKPWHVKSRHPYKYLFFHYLNIVKQSGWPINISMQIAFLLMWVLKLKDIPLDYFKKIYRKRILSSKPIACNGDSEFEVHILTSKKDFLNTIWCLKTFYHYSGIRPKLVIHEDGTLSRNSIKTFLKHFVNCRVIRRKNATKDLRCFLANYKYSQKNRLNKDFFCALKLFDSSYYAKTDKLLMLDSDILFFKKPNEMIECIKEDKPFFNSDYQNAYAKPVNELNKILGVEILPMVNARLMFLRKECYINNLDFIENYFEKMEKVIPIPDLNRHEQTLHALLLSKCRAIRLNENYQILKQPITDKTVCHYFVNDGSRNDFYKKGLKYLKLNNFLEELNRIPHS